MMKKKLTTKVNTIEIITDDFEKPYGLYVSLYRNKLEEKLIIQIHKLPGIKFKNVDNCKKLVGDIAI